MDSELMVQGCGGLVVVNFYKPKILNPKFVGVSGATYCNH